MHVYNDNIAKATAISLEKDIKQMQVTQFKVENQQLRRKVTCLNEELKIVNWYLDVMEKGLRPPKEIMELYEKDQKMFAEAEKKFKTKINKLTTKLQHVRAESKKTFDIIVKQQT